MKRFVTIFSLLIAIVVGLYFLTLNSHKESNDRFAVSWMRAWATTGQVMCALENTNAATLTKSDATFPDFLFGPQMNEAAIAGEVDATNTGIVPTINLLSSDQNWIVVGRLIDFPVAIVVPQESDINSISDLRGKKVGVPFGGGSHPYIIQRLQENNLEIGSGNDAVELINLTPPDQPIAYKRGDIDAVATWEPQTAISLSQKPSKIIDRDRHIGFLSVSKKYAQNNPQQVVNILKAYLLANWYVTENRKITDEWFASVSGFKDDLISRIEVIEPNLNAKKFTDISMMVSDADIKTTQTVADIMYQHKLTARHVNFKSHVDMHYLEQALKDLPQLQELSQKIMEKD
jgi:sulfonate transport system substrate-binding protein|tara:strand:- start:3588 stop:4625 length:1038 start_codon:yes stop_codon:yes gene_type:complete